MRTPEAGTAWSHIHRFSVIRYDVLTLHRIHAGGRGSEQHFILMYPLCLLKDLRDLNQLENIGFRVAHDNPSIQMPSSSCSRAWHELSYCLAKHPELPAHTCSNPVSDRQSVIHPANDVNHCFQSIIFSLVASCGAFLSLRALFRSVFRWKTLPQR